MIVPEKRDPKQTNFILKAQYQRIGAKIEIVTFSDVFLYFPGLGTWKRLYTGYV